MKIRTTLLALLGVSTLALPALEAQHPKPEKGDPLSGTWQVTFLVPGYAPTPATFELAVNGEKVTGTVQSEHTGRGKVTEGVWKDGKLSFIAVFDTHESIAISGGIEHGKLGGEFRTEGFVAKWEATKAP